MNTTQSQPNNRQFTLATLSVMLLLSACTNSKPLNAGKTAARGNPAPAEESLTQLDFPGWHNPMLARSAELAGQALIGNLKSAQKALDLNEQEKAQHYLNASKDLAKGIRTMMPFTVMVDQIRNAKDNITDNADLVETDTLLPLYQSLEELDVYAPEVAQQSKTKVGQVEKLAKSGKNIQAVEILDQVEADIADTTVYMPVITVSQYIDGALDALTAKPADKIYAQVEIDLALSSMIDKTHHIALLKKAH
jgi:hypothetical protein